MDNFTQQPQQEQQCQDNNNPSIWTTVLLIVTVVLLLLGVAGGYMYYQQSSELNNLKNEMEELKEKKGELEEKVSIYEAGLVREIQMKAIEAQTKTITEKIAAIISIWFIENKEDKTYTDFWDDQDVLQEIDLKIDNFENSSGLSVNYRIDTTELNYVIRLQVEEQNSVFCCTDSTSSKVQTITFSENGFASKNSCNGKELE